MFENFKYRKYGYLVLSQTLKNEDGDEYIAYGITVMSGEEEILTISDISTNYEEIRRLAEICTNDGLDPIHINDVIEDFLAGLSVT